MSKRVVIVGQTGQGDFGHYLERSFVGVEGAEIVALSDSDEAGRQKNLKLSGAAKGYADYQEMLKIEKPDIAVIATHHLGNHLKMVLSAVEQGAHVYIEKPLATTLGEVDQMLDACEKAGVLLIMAHPWRGHPEIQKKAIPILREGKIGKPGWARIHGSCPMWRPEWNFGEFAGDQWMIDLYPHHYDFICQLFGAPLWCQSMITKDGRPATPSDIEKGVFGLELTAGNGILAHYQFDEFVLEFVSILGNGESKPQGEATLYGIEIHGTSGTLFLPGAIKEGPDIYYHPDTHPTIPGNLSWEVLAHNPNNGTDKWIHAHHRMARSMLDMLEGKKPDYELCQGRDARVLVEMSIAARLAHIQGSRVPFPIEESGDPFKTWQ